jgi:hypothetical protein
MKVVITQNDRNHSNFILEMAVLGFELRPLSCMTENYALSEGSNRTLTIEKLKINYKTEM